MIGAKKYVRRIKDIILVIEMYLSIHPIPEKLNILVVTKFEKRLLLFEMYVLKLEKSTDLP